LTVDGRTRGIATALLDGLDRAEPAQRAVVSTGTANHPALALYRRRGFVPIGTRQIAPGTSITILERHNTPARRFADQKP
jgi:ribosomal protein S18 acetylase RimI-like enzyme